jgi:hypothetical protein
MRDLKVKEDSNYVRRDGVAIVNINNSEYELALKRREKAKELKDLKEKVARLESLVNQLLLQNTSFK